MDPSGTDQSPTATVAWRRLAEHDVGSPLVASVPCVELALEHPDLEASGHAPQFVPDAVPYELAGERRVVFWRPALDRARTAAADAPAAPERDDPAPAEPDEWTAACATTHGLAGVDATPAEPPALATPDGETTHAVVDGTVAGGGTTAPLVGYEPPTVQVESVAPAAATLSVDGREVRVAAGSRRRIELPERRARRGDGGADGGNAAAELTVTPVLTARYPGERVLHHPAPGTGERCFPSFGLALEDVPEPLPVPTTAGELDHLALAEQLGVDLSERPYPERVLWQAFAFEAFDPHADGASGVAQPSSGHLVVDPPAARDGAD